jgi:hypothetical protein
LRTDHRLFSVVAGMLVATAARADAVIDPVPAGTAVIEAAPVVADDDPPWSLGRFTVAMPIEAHVIGFAAGPHPELMWRPFARDGVTHLVVSVGVQPGNEYLFVPVDVGVRWRFAPAWFFQPWLGVGVQGQTMFVSDGGPFFRPAVTTEVGVAVAIDDVAAVGVGVTPSLAPLGVPGPGLAVRLTVTLALEAMLSPP